MSLSDTAALLGMRPATVARMTAAGSLYCIEVDGMPQYPAWQFVGAEPLPGLPAVVGVLGALGYSTGELEAFMSSPAESLGGLSPREHLLRGGDPGLLRRHVDELAWTPEDGSSPEA